jgi:hypothetical protein
MIDLKNRIVEIKRTKGSLNEKNFEISLLLEGAWSNGDMKAHKSLVDFFFEINEQIVSAESMNSITIIQDGTLPDIDYE